MEQHAAAARRKLEEIRQKRAAEKSKMIQSGSEQDLGSLKVQNERDTLRKQLDESLQQIQILKTQLQDAETRASNVGELKQAMKNLSLERDAAVMAKEDLLAQLRLTRKRLQEAEDEQYKAEEDAAVLRAELKTLQNSEVSARSQSVHDHYGVSEHELKSVKAELQDALQQLQQQHQSLVVEQQKVFKLAAEKKELELKLTKLSELEQNKEKEKQASVNSATQESIENKWKYKVESGKYEQHVRELASMVQRLENGRQKLLAEIDMQSLEIEKLFMENAGLVTGLNETSEIAARWERQLRETMKQNIELQRVLEELSTSGSAAEGSDASALRLDIVERDQLNTQIAQLSLELDSAKHKLSGFHRLYGPVLSSLETKLLQMKQHPLHLDASF